MFGLFGPFGWDPKYAAVMRERQESERQARLAKGGIPWSLNIKWEHHLTLQAKTWVSWSLFDVEPPDHHNPNYEQAPAGKFEISPSGSFMYCVKRLKRGQMIGTI